MIKISKSKKFFNVLLSLALILSPVLVNVQNVFAEEENTTITIFHTNDMHGSVSDLAYVKTLKDNTENSILVDAGDAAQGSSLATYTEGLGIIELMNIAGYDGMTLGNHEFDYGTEATIAMVEAANFPVVSANVFDRDNNILLDSINSGNGQNFIVEIEGIKVGFFGITTTETAYKTHPGKLDGVTFAPEIDTAREQVAILEAQGVDIIVGLVHVGIDATSDPTGFDIAREVEGIDLIIDGHSHSTLPNGELIENTLVVQTGTKLANIGVVEIEVDTNDNSIVSIAGELVKLSDVKESHAADTDFTTAYNALNEELDEILNEVVTRTDTAIFADALGTRASRLEETPAGSLVADAMVYGGNLILDELGIDNYPVVAMQNGGGVRANINNGNITLGSILDVLPFGNMIAIKEITPDVLYKILEHGYKDTVLTSDNFIDVSNANGGFAQISGMRAVVDVTKPADQRVVEIYLVDDVTGVETLLQRSDTTTPIAFVSNDFLISGGDGFSMLIGLNHIAEGPTLDSILRDYIIDNSENDKFTYAHTSGRITISQIEEIQNTGYVNIVPNIQLSPNQAYEVVIDGIKSVTIQTDENGYFKLEKLTSGMHTVTVDGTDRYVSTYTGLGLTSFEVFIAPSPVNPEIVGPEVVNPEVINPSPTLPGQGPNTSDNTSPWGYVSLLVVSAGCLMYLKKRSYQTDVVN